MGDCRKFYLLVIVLTLFALTAGAEVNDKSLLGVYGGWAYGSSVEEDWNPSARLFDRYKLLYHFGGYFQRDLSPEFGLQCNVNFQQVKHYSSFQDFNAPEMIYEPERRLLVALNLLAVLQLPLSARAQIFVQGGGGIGSGTVYGLSGLHFGLTGGAGLKLFPKPGSRSAVIVGGSFHLLIDRSASGSATANYVRFNVGYEFVARSPRE